MSRHHRAALPDRTGTLVIGLLFTVIGAALLVERIWYVDVWRYLWRLWPVLLIVMGVKTLIDYYRRKRISSSGAEQ